MEKNAKLNGCVHGKKWLVELTNAWSFCLQKYTFLRTVWLGISRFDWLFLSVYGIRIDWFFLKLALSWLILICMYVYKSRYVCMYICFLFDVYMFHLYALHTWRKINYLSIYFSNVQPCTITCTLDAALDVLLNTRICRYTCIYITPTVQSLHYCPAGTWCWIDVYWCLCDFITSRRRHFDGICLLGVTKTGVQKAVRPWKWNLPCSVRCISNKIWTQITPFFICSAWLYVKELEKIIARTLCFTHQSVFRPNYICN